MISTVVATMKNEGPYLLEWVAHQVAVGFDEIVVCHADDPERPEATDGTGAMLERLAELDLVHPHSTRIRKGGFERSALRQARELEPVTRADWVFVCAGNEYLNVHSGRNKVADLVVASGPNPDVIHVPWRVFGSNGIERFADRPVTRQFEMAEAPPHRRRNREAGADHRSLFTGTERFAGFGEQEPVPADDLAETLSVVHPGGAPIDARFPAFDLAQVNHYAFRGLEASLPGMTRSARNEERWPEVLQHWQTWNRNAVADTSIRRYNRASRPIFTALMSDPDLERLHFAAIDWHRARIDACLEEPGIKALLPQLRASVAAPAAARATEAA